MPPRCAAGVTSVRSCVSARGVVLLVAAFFVQTTSGCLSNEYRIERDELRRLASLPPEVRGAHVRVSQDLNERRGDAVDASELEVPRSDSFVDVRIDVGGGSSSTSSSGAGSWRSGPEGVVRGTPSPAGGGFRGTPPPSSGGGFHGTPPSSSGGGFHGTPPSSSGGFHGGGGGGTWRGSPPSGGGGVSLPSGGGGGSGIGDDLAAIVVAIIIGAAIATVVLAASEGMRFAGDARMSPEQPLYVRDAQGNEHEVALGDLTRQDAELAKEAIVKDDEGWGLRQLAHGPIQRKGGTFRFELGAGAFSLGAARASGVASHVQVGGYLTPTFGLVLDLAFSSADVDPECCIGPLIGPTSLSRDSLGLQAELTPLSLGPLHLGAFAGGGVAIAGSSGDREQGPMAIAGARLELELTAHMALTVRGGASTAHLPSGWLSAAELTGGLAIY
jgi:hypothetical protein